MLENVFIISCMLAFLLTVCLLNCQICSFISDHVVSSCLTECIFSVAIEHLTKGHMTRDFSMQSVVCWSQTSKY